LFVTRCKRFAWHDPTRKNVHPADTAPALFFDGKQQPVGLASLFVSVSSGKENPCAAALKIAGEGTPKTTAKSGKEKEQKGTSEKKKEGLGSKVKNLFSKPKD